MKIGLNSMRWNVEESSVYPSVRVIMNIVYAEDSSKKQVSASSFGWASANNHALYQSVASSMRMKLHNCNWGGSIAPLYPDVARLMGVYLPGSEFEVQSFALYPPTAVLMGLMDPTTYKYQREPIKKSVSAQSGEKPIYKSVACRMGIKFKPDGDGTIAEAAVAAPRIIVSAGGLTYSSDTGRHSNDAWAHANSHSLYAAVANAMGMRLPNCDWGANPPMYPGVAELMNVDLPNSHWNINEAPVYPSVAILLGLKIGTAKEEVMPYVSNWPAEKVTNYGWASASNHGMYQSVANAMNIKLPNCEWGAADAPLYDAVAELMNVTIPGSRRMNESALYPSVEIIMMLDRGTVQVDAGSSSSGWAAGSNHPLYQSVANAMGLKLSHCDWGTDLAVYDTVARNMTIRFKNSHWKVKDAALYPSTAILMKYMSPEASTYKRASRKQSSEKNPFVSNVVKAQNNAGTKRFVPVVKQEDEEDWMIIKKTPEKKAPQIKRQSWLGRAFQFAH